MDHTSKAIVAIKVMRNKDQFLKEIKSRQRVGGFNPDLVANILCYFDCDEEGSKISQELMRFGLKDFPYSIVMPGTVISFYISCNISSPHFEDDFLY